MKVVAKTDKGKVRTNNEDYYFIDETRGVFIVADGIGGHKAGEVASSLTTQIISEYVNENLTKCKDVIPKLIRDSIDHANKIVYDISKNNKECDGMGTTISMGILIENILYIGHVGDSRVYLYRDSILKQITEDHTLVNELVKNGTLTEEEARNYPNKNIITKAIGTNDKIISDLFEIKVKKDDLFVFCTDGFSDNITVDELKKLIEENENLDNLSKKMIEYANVVSGSDNITVLIFKV